MIKNIFSALAIVCFANAASAQNRYVDSVMHWIATHEKIDSEYVLNLHKISYRLSETDVKKSFLYYERVSSVSDSLGFIYGKSLAQINLALLLFNSANFDASNQAYFKAIGYAEKGNYTRLTAISLNNIAENFFTLKDFEKCREYTLKAIELNTKIKAGRGIAVNYELLFRCNMDEQQYKQAGADLQAGIPYAETSKDSYIISPYYLGLGRLHAVYHHVDSAAYYYDKALQQAQQENDLRNEYEVYLSRASSLSNQSAQQQLAGLRMALQIARQTEYLKGIADAAMQLSEVYDGQSNKDSSFFYFRIYRLASDSLFSENNKRNVIIKESEWVLRKKEIENDHLKNISGLQQKEILAQNSLLIGSTVTLVLAIALGLLAFRNIRSKKRQVELEKKQQEAEMKSQITDMEFKAFKAQLNPHFIFNYLNSISGYILLSQPQKAAGMIKRFSKMLRNVLQNSELNEVPLADDINTIEQYLELMHEIASPPFTYSIQAPDELRAFQKCVPPLFIQPYVENALVHGLKNAEGDDLFLHIEYRQSGLALQVTIIDNGTGFNPKILRSLQFQDDRLHLGLSVTEKRIQVFAEKNRLNAKISFTTPNPGSLQPGTSVQVVVEHFFA